MKKLSDNIRLIQKIFRLGYSFNPKITLFEFLHGFCVNLKKIINTVSLAIVVNMICDGAELNYIFFATVLYGLCNCLLGCGEKCFKQFQEAHGFRACNLLRLSLNRKFMRIDYADTENAKIRDEFEKAKDSMWEFCDVGYVLFDDIVGNLLTFVCMSYVLAELSFITYFWIIFLIAISLFIQHRKNQFIHTSELKEKVIKKQMNYLASVMQDFKTGKEIRIFGAEEFWSAKYSSEAGKYKKQIEEKENNVVKLSVVQALLSFGEIVMVYMSAMKKYMAGSLQIGSFLIYISSIKRVAESINNLLLAFIELSRVSNYYQDFERFMSIPENMKNEGNEKIMEQKDNIIEFRNVSYCYPGTKINVLDNISFTFSQNEKIAIVGENGAGKSTLIKLLLRLYHPTEGQILLNGKNISLYKYEEYLKIYNSVFQDFSVMAYSIRENINFGQKSEGQKLDELLAITGLDKHLEKYTEGVDSYITKVLDDKGVNLSGGELQLMAICRAFYRNAKILVFDEPTASLDSINEARIFELIRKMSDNKMVIFCAHRMSSTKFCNKILVMEKGRIKEMGNHMELMKENGVYHDLFVQQSSLYKTDAIPSD